MEKLLAIDPDITAIVSSCNAKTRLWQIMHNSALKGVVPKPFTVPQLSRVLYQVLGPSV